jgi:NAD(P)-dependent dehydrogenase (short-subunit alcohol dehydrogenase family)
MPKVVFITGISSGFGKKTAELLAAKGHIVYGTIRKGTETLQNINVLKMDLLDHSSIKQAVTSVIQKEGRIDVLINNAGAHTGGSIETSPIENIRLQMDTNVMGMVYLLREVLPAMRQQQEGTIINFSSIGGLMGLPFQGYYSASKFAIEGISEALRMEVKPFNVKVVVINPGDFHTNNTANRRNFLAKTANDPYSEQFAKSLSIIEKDENGGWPPEVLARKLVKIVETKNPCQRYIIATAEQKLAVVLKKVLPSSWFMKILAPHYGIR